MMIQQLFEEAKKKLKRQTELLEEMGKIQSKLKEEGICIEIILKQ